MKRHWYFLSTWYCVICSRTVITRERRYGRKPKDPTKTHEVIENACGYHFL